MINLTKIIAIAFLFWSIALNNYSSVLADSIDANTSDTVKQAAQEVVKDTGAKEQFGKTENGDRLIDNAQQKASKKLDNLADEANSDSELPDSKKMFLDNLTNKK